MPEPPRENLTVVQLAEHWNVSPTTIRRLVSKGLPYRRIGGQLRFSVREADLWQKVRDEKLNDLLTLRSSQAFDLGHFFKSAKMKSQMTPNPIAALCKLTYIPTKKMFSGSVRDPLQNKTKTKFVPVDASQAGEEVAREWLIDFEKKLHANFVIQPSGSPTLRSLFEKWKEHLNTERKNRDGKKLDPKTAQKWIGCIKGFVLTTQVADIPITNDTFDTEVVKTWVLKLVDKSSDLTKEKISTYYVRDCVQALRQLIDDARDLKWIKLSANPVSDTLVRRKVPRSAPRSGKNNPIHMTKEEAITLMTAKINAPLGRQVLTIVALCTGARLRELWGLAWRHIDLKRGTLEIQRQVVEGGATPEFKDPKKESFRTLPLHPLAIEVLAFWKEQFPKVDPEGPVFPRQGTWDSYEMWRDASGDLRADMVQAGISDLYDGAHNFDFHSTRRTFMTLLSNATVPDEKISVLAGHAKIDVMRHYLKENLEKYRPIILRLPFKGARPAFLPKHAKVVKLPRRSKKQEAA